MYPCRKIIFALLFLLFMAPVAIAKGEVASHIGDVSFKTAADSSITVDFVIKEVWSARLIKTLESGLPVRFTYTVRIVRLDKTLWEGDLVNHRFERVLKKDNLKNRYIITSSEKRRDFISLDDAIEEMTMVDSYPICNVAQLSPSGEYQVEIQVKLEEFRLPFMLHRFLPFVSHWDVQTPWRRDKIPSGLYR